MNWQERLITIYLYVCKHYQLCLCGSAFTRLISQITQLCGVCAALESGVRCVCALIGTDSARTRGQESRQVWLIDSFPVALAKQCRRFEACVAKALADSGYCSTKKLYYYGVRVHVIGRRQSGSLPIPGYIGVTGASDHEGKIFDQIRPYLHNNELYGDKAYQRPDAEAVRQAQNLAVLISVKKTTKATLSGTPGSMAAHRGFSRSATD